MTHMFKAGQNIKLVFHNNAVIYVPLTNDAQARQLENDIKQQATALHTIEADYGDTSEVYLNFAMLIRASVYSETEI